MAITITKDPNVIYVNKEIAEDKISTARNEALTYKNLAVQASDSAIAAKDIAIQASSDAEQYRNSILSSEQNVTTLTSNVSGIKDDMIALRDTTNQYKTEANNILTSVGLKETSINNTLSTVSGLKDTVVNTSLVVEAHKDLTLGYRNTTEQLKNEAQVDRIAVANMLAEFKGIYYGSRTNLEIPEGIDVLDGDLYYNSDTNNLMLRNNGLWQIAIPSLTDLYTKPEIDTLLGFKLNSSEFTNNAIKNMYELNDDTNAYTDAERAKLGNIEINATQDQTDIEIEALYEGLPNTNKYTDAEKAKLSGIEDNANNYVLPLDITADSIQLNGGIGTQGLVTWNNDEETLDLVQNGSILQLGQEVQVSCVNQSGVGINDGTVVMATGTLGASGKITIAPYDISMDVKYIVGVTTEDILNGESGKVTTFGKIRNINTSLYNEGDILYVDDNGGLTNVEPITTKKVPIAFVINSHSNNGTIMVRTIPVDLNASTVASTIYYDNTNSGLIADNVNDAIDELKTNISTIEEW